MDRQEELLAKLQVYRNLVKSAGWVALVELANGQIEVRKNLLNDLEIKEISGIADFNYAKGEIAAIRLFLSFPDLLVENIKETLHDEFPDEEREDGSGEGRDDDGFDATI
jgi:hypothetical protein